MFKTTNKDRGHASRQANNPENRPCGHVHHHGSCPDCQRIQIDRWNVQLADAASRDRR